jgi:hypothetical protein
MEVHLPSVDKGRQIREKNQGFVRQQPTVSFRSAEYTPTSRQMPPGLENTEDIDITNSAMPWGAPREVYIIPNSRMCHLPTIRKADPRALYVINYKPIKVE